MTTQEPHFLDVFSEQQANTLLPHRKYDLQINLLSGKAPQWGRMYTKSALELVEMKAYLKAYMEIGFIRPSQSPAAAPVMFVKRPDGKLRLVVDYRGLNVVTVKNRFPLPLIPEMLDRLNHAKVFTPSPPFPLPPLSLSPPRLIPPSSRFVS